MAAPRSLPCAPHARRVAFTLLLLLLAAPAQSVQPHRILNFIPVNVDPVIDGQVTFPAEWANANVLPDSGNVGAIYSESRKDWIAQSSTNNFTPYFGVTGFMLHDYDLWNWPSLDAYNVFEFTHRNGEKVTIWVFGGEDTLDDSGWLLASGLTNSRLVPEGAGADSIDDRGFIVRKNDDPNTDRHWLPGMLEPGDGAFDWNQWYGVFGWAAFNNSGFLSGLPNAIDGANWVFEVASYDPIAEPDYCSWLYVKSLDEKDPTAPRNKRLLEEWHFGPQHYGFRIICPDSISISGPEDLGKLVVGLTYQYQFTSTQVGGGPVTMTSSAGTLPGTSGAYNNAGKYTLTITPQPGQEGQEFLIGLASNNGRCQCENHYASYYVYTTTSVPPVAQRSTWMRAQPSVTHGTTRIMLGHAMDAPAQVLIVDATGRRVRSLTLARGSNAVDWDGLDDQGLPVAVGLYLIGLSGSSERAHTRVVMLR